MSKTQLDLMAPIPVRRALGKLGQDIRDARRGRRIPTAVMAEWASIGRTILNKVEKGDPGVSLQDILSAVGESRIGAGQ